MPQWDPHTYLQFANERSRPFVDLVQRIDGRPQQIVDLGCGPGQLTAGLLDRWPRARVLGLDSSPSMIRTAEQLPARPGLEFRLQDLRAYVPESGTDLILSNAALQWVPGHRDLFGGWIEALPVGGRLAFQVPGNFAEPSHALLRELADRPRYAEWTAGVEYPASFDAATYLDDLMGLGCAVDAWETTYHHVLHGPDPVFTWISGTGARPVLQSLPEAVREEFIVEYKNRLNAAYPARPYGTVLPFRRIFVVAVKP